MAGEDSQMANPETYLEKSSKTKEKKKRNKDATIEALKELPLEQQINALLSKYTELSDDNKKLQIRCKSFEKNIAQSQKEKDKAELDLSKAILTRSRLESLCRELQKQNKQIKEDSISRLKEEEERRKEVSSQFNSTFNEISRLMEENTHKNSKLREENQDMASQLKELIDQHKKREEHVDKAITQKQLEAQLADAKLKKAQLEFREEKEKMLMEKKNLLEELAVYQKKHENMALNELNLRTQLESYCEKYQDFQGALDKSDQIFKNFKKEMDDMKKVIKKLEKESKTWKDRSESANKALFQMVNERSQMESKIEYLNKQNNKLQSLCRALQQQVADMRIQLKNKDIKESDDSPQEEVPKLSPEPVGENPAASLEAPSQPPLQKDSNDISLNEKAEDDDDKKAEEDEEEKVVNHKPELDMEAVD